MIKNVDQCVYRIIKYSINDKNSEEDIEELLSEIMPFLRKKYGEKLTTYLEELIKNRFLDTAISYVQALPRRHRSFNLMRFIMIFICLIPIGFGIYFVNWGYNLYNDSRQSNSWPSTLGVIVRSDFKSAAGDRYSRSYKHDIKYTYTVGSEKYTSDRVSYEDSDSPKRIIKRYPVGKKVNVFYKAKKPKISVLEHKKSNESFLILGTSLIFFGLSVYMFIKFTED